MHNPLIFAWPCGHEVQPDECQCMRCYVADRYGADECHEPVRLFTPVAPQIPGQLSL
jgi:hypothetical protein